MAMRSTLGRVRGLGSAKEGVGHWTAQRLTAIALVPLTFWFVYSVFPLIGADYDVLTLWLAIHGNALLLVLFIPTLFYHAMLGVQVVIEDYVHHEGIKLTALVAVKFTAVLIRHSTCCRFPSSLRESGCRC